MFIQQAALALLAAAIAHSQSSTTSSEQSVISIFGIGGIGGGPGPLDDMPVEDIYASVVDNVGLVRGALVDVTDGGID
jgi:hypothetical protein